MTAEKKKKELENSPLKLLNRKRGLLENMQQITGRGKFSVRSFIDKYKLKTIAGITYRTKRN